MRTLPVIGGRDANAALVVRTDYGDEGTWRAIAVELTQPWGVDEEYQAYVHFVDDPAWTGATPDEVQAAVRAADRLISVVFLADSTAMQHSHYALLAVKVADGEQGNSSTHSEEGVPLSPSFRLEPGAVQDVHGQLFIDNLSFEDFAEAARRDADDVLRSPY
ncbi:DUF6924 domain-containing protein [Streptomyces sp. CWNU-52B]